MLRRSTASFFGAILLGACQSVSTDIPTSAGIADVNYADTKSAQAKAEEIKRLEHRWSQAFVNKDYDFIESIVAPDFMLVIFEGSAMIIPRKYWMMNTRKWDIQEFSENVLDVAVRNDTAVATVEGSWRIMDEGKQIRDDSFFFTDTWVKSGDSWQIIRRHSQTTEDRLANE